jgi:nucleotide-binding universal stress UspA family protein
MPPITRILAPTDFDPASDAGLRYAAWLAAEYGAELLVVHIFTAGQVPLSDLTHRPEGFGRDAYQREWEALEEQAARVFGEEAVRPELRIMYGDPELELRKLIDDERVDLVVITVKNRSRVGKLILGSRAQDIILSSPVPVVSVKPDLTLGRAHRP